MLTLAFAVAAVLALGASSCEDGFETTETTAPAAGAQCDPPTADSVTSVVRGHPELSASETDVESVDCRVSPSDPAWVAVTVSAGEQEPNVAILHSAPQSDTGWELLAIGTAGVGCLDVPGAVQAELGLDCPGG